MRKALYLALIPIVLGVGCSKQNPLAVETEEKDPTKVVETSEESDVETAEEFLQRQAMIDSLTQIVIDTLRFETPNGTVEDCIYGYFYSNGASVKEWADGRLYHVVKEDALLTGILERFGFSPVLANFASITNVKRFNDFYMSKWKETIPENAIYHGQGDNTGYYPNWYNVASNSGGLEFFNQISRFYAVLHPDKQITVASAHEKAVALNEKMKNCFEIIPIVMEGSNKAFGYKTTMKIEEPVVGDLKWVQDTMRHYGFDVTLYYPNCTTPHLRGYNSNQSSQINWKLYDLRTVTTNGNSPIEYIVIPPIFQ